MAIEMVPAGDDRCDVCAGDPDRPEPKPGESWAERPVSAMCEACYKDLSRDLWIDREINKLESPDDPSDN